MIPLSEQSFGAPQAYRDRHRLRIPSCLLSVESFDDPEALWEAVLELRLEGVVAKRESERYRPGERLWIRRKRLRWRER